MKRLWMIMCVATTLGGCTFEDAAMDTPVEQSKTVVESFEAANVGEAGYVYGYHSQILDFEHHYNEEWGSWAGFAPSTHFDMEDASYDNQFSVYNSSAASGDVFAMFYYDSFNEPTDILCRYYGYYTFRSVRLNLSTICYKAVTEGNDFARAFADGDYLKVEFIALEENQVEGDVVEFYAVDYRDGKRFIADEWNYVDLSSLQGDLWGLRIRITTTDCGEWGANTPLYVCLDDLTYSVITY